MPYLHWDTARHQRKVKQAIREENERYVKEVSTIENNRGGPRDRNRGLQLSRAQGKQPDSAFRLENQKKCPDNSQGPSPKPSATSAFASIMKRHGRCRKLQVLPVFVTDRAGRVTAGTKLGQVLFDAAMLYEAMLAFQERSLVRKYLNADLPLHPRRTLEQTNEWTLGLSWHASARDQVLLRATKPKQLDFHSLDPFSKEWKDRLRKVPRLMMIDQLWMWILDEQTIITCFPDHGELGGYNHLKVPGIHRNIRDTIIKPKSRIRSVLDLAMIIFGEVQLSRCSIGGVNVGIFEHHPLSTISCRR